MEEKGNIEGFNGSVEKTVQTNIHEQGESSKNLIVHIAMLRRAEKENQESGEKVEKLNRDIGKYNGIEEALREQLVEVKESLAGSLTQIADLASENSVHEKDILEFTNNKKKTKIFIGGNFILIFILTMLMLGGGVFDLQTSSLTMPVVAILIAVLTNSVNLLFR